MKELVEQQDRLRDSNKREIKELHKVIFTKVSLESEKGKEIEVEG